MNNYIFVYDHSSMMSMAPKVGAFIESHKYISEWALLFAGAYFLKSDHSIKEIDKTFSDFFNPNYYVIAEIGKFSNKTDGVLPMKIWEWLSGVASDSAPLLPGPKQEV